MGEKMETWEFSGGFRGGGNSFNSNLKNQATLDFLIQLVLQSCLIVQLSSRLSTAVARPLNWRFFHFPLVTKCTHWTNKIKQTWTFPKNSHLDFVQSIFVRLLKCFEKSFSEADIFQRFKSDFILAGDRYKIFTNDWL